MYVLAASAPAPVTPVTLITVARRALAPAGVQLVDYAGQVTGDTITVRLNGQAGDRAVVAINTKAAFLTSRSRMAARLTSPDPYWVGTQQFTVAAGPVVADHRCRHSEARRSWVGRVRCVAAVIYGRRCQGSDEGPGRRLVTSPRAAVRRAAGLVLAFGFLSFWSAGRRLRLCDSRFDWLGNRHRTQDGANYQTVLLAKYRVLGALSAMARRT